MEDKEKDFLIENKFLQIFVPFIPAFRSETKLKKKIEKLNDEHAYIEINGNNEDDLLEIVREHHHREFDRDNKIEDKAKSSLFIVTLSITFILGSLNYINGVNTWIIPEIIVLIVLIIGVFYLVFAAVTSIKTIHATPSYDIYIDNRIEGFKSSFHDNLKMVKINKKQEINTLYECIKLNELWMIIKLNFMDATFAGLRNGIILVSVFFILVVINVILNYQIVEIIIKFLTN